MLINLDLKGVDMIILEDSAPDLEELYNIIITH